LDIAALRILNPQQNSCITADVTRYQHRWVSRWVTLLLTLCAATSLS